MKVEQEKNNSRTKEIRERTERLGQSLKDWHYRNRCQGAELRQQRLVNHRICLERESSDLEEKKIKAVSKRQKSFRI